MAVKATTPVHCDRCGFTGLGDVKPRAPMAMGLGLVAMGGLLGDLGAAATAGWAVFCPKCGLRLRDALPRETAAIRNRRMMRILVGALVAVLLVLLLIWAITPTRYYH